MDSVKLKRQKIPLKRRNWSVEEDDAIISIVTSDPTLSWTEITQILSEEPVLKVRTGKQCKERWTNHLDPSLDKGTWSTSELLDLFTAHSQIGNKWAQIRQFIPHRSENSIKNQFYSSIRKQFRKWKGYQPQLQHIQKHGDKLAGQILAHLRKEDKREPKEKTLADIDPIQDSSEGDDFEGICDFYQFY